MEFKLAAEARTGTGKGVNRKLRAVGKVPATLYGTGAQAKTITVTARDLGHALHTDAGRNVLIDLELDGESHLTLARELQRDPIRGTYIHVDFLLINRDTAIQVDVSIHVQGESPGVKEGGAVEHHMWNVKLECLPGNVPENVVADVSTLKLGDVFHVSDLKLPEGVTLVTPGEEVILAVVIPQTLKLEEEPAVVEGAEPVVAPAEGGETPTEGETAS